MSRRGSRQQDAVDKLSQTTTTTTTMGAKEDNAVVETNLCGVFEYVSAI
jgi:hypothetical protein